MLEFNTHAGNVRLIGGRLCLNFVNTLDCHTCAQPKEYLADYTALVVWGRHAGLLPDDAARRLLAEAVRRQPAAAAALVRAKQLRSALYRIFSRQAGITEDIAILNHALAETSAQIEVARTRAGFAWAWGREAGRLDQLLGPLAWSAAELLTSADLALVRECEGERCSWLFVDASRNRTRRWCSMVDCGNRAKARRHYIHTKRVH
jgi:predicted RNA-binding Zn ribbon-like protein